MIRPNLDCLRQRNTVKECTAPTSVTLTWIPAGGIARVTRPESCLRTSGARIMMRFVISLSTYRTVQYRAGNGCVIYVIHCIKTWGRSSCK